MTTLFDVQYTKARAMAEGGEWRKRYEEAQAEYNAQNAELAPYTNPTDRASANIWKHLADTYQAQRDEYRAALVEQQAHTAALEAELEAALVKIQQMESEYQSALKYWKKQSTSKA